MPKKLLIVDDNVINRQMLIRALKSDYDVIEAENGREAIALMHREFNSLSAVLLDIMMPEMDGYEVLRLAREDEQLSQLPIIVVTGADNQEARLRALSLGANDFIQKPFNPDIVKHCLSNNITLRETATMLNVLQKDKLTGLYTREAFFARVADCIKQHEPGYYILSCFDIDGFKLINDQFGMAAGDRILRDISESIKTDIEGKDIFASRITADNFAALIPAAEPDTLTMKRISEKRLVDFDKQPISFSIGRYLITDLSLSAGAIYNRAYIAKQSVKGRYDVRMAHFDEVMLKKLVRDQQIVSEMETALKQKQFEIWFQPQYNHSDVAVIGAEALVRWRHPVKGLIPPGEFIPLFEQNGFIYELDKYVWRETCSYMRKWIDEGLSPMPVSVNVSRYDIYRADLIDVITGLMTEFKLPNSLLRLEITESAFTTSTKHIVTIVEKLIELGFTVEIDDFGSGYSSLNTLKSVPAQVVKLDMRFLESGNDAQRGGSIIESIVRMVKWLGMTVIAEGVETKEQGDFLKSIGCSYVQGYLYAKPMPVGEYEAYCDNARKDARPPLFETVKHLDSNMLWDPVSMDTLIFNSYVGAACIMEYYDGRMEVLRATDKYAQMLGGEGMTVDKVLKLDVFSYLSDESRELALKKVYESAQSMGEVTLEPVFINLPDCPREVYLRSNLRVIAIADDRYLVYCISENITAQRVSERKERRTAKQLKLVLDNVSIGITAISVDDDSAELLISNGRYYELLGYTAEQYRAEHGGKAFTSVCPEDRRRVADTVERVWTTYEPATIEYRAFRRDGSVIWLRSSLSMSYFDDIGKFVQLRTYADITHEKHLAQDLLDNLPCGAGICTVAENDAHITYLNKRYLTYFKHNDGMRAQDSVFGVIHPDDRANLKKAMLPALQKGGEGSCIVRIADGPDEYIPFRVSGVALESTGETNSIYVTFVPISHEAFSFSEVLAVALKKMMSSSTTLSFIKDKNLRYISCSSAFARMVGYESDKDIIGKTDYDLFDKELAEKYINDDRKLIESNHSLIDSIERIPSPDGKSRYSSTSKYLLNDAYGNFAGIYGVGRDVTQTLEAELQHKFLINSIPGGVAVYEGEWSSLESIKLTYFSDGFCQLFGYTRDEYERMGAINPTGLVIQSDIPGLVAQIEALVRTGKPLDYIYRARVKDGGNRWIHIKAVISERQDAYMIVNAVFFDVTERQNMLEQLRVSEEENRLAISHSKNIVCRYDVTTRTLRVSPSVSTIFDMPLTIVDVPYAQVECGAISPETADSYISFYENIVRGEKNSDAVFQRRSTIGWRWIEAHSSSVLSSSGAAVSAVISFLDVTESFEKDIVYKKWLQSLRTKDPDAYSLYRCNISKRRLFDTTEGELHKIRFKQGNQDLEDQMEYYANNSIIEEDIESFKDFMNIDTLLDKYSQGDLLVTLEYREKVRPDVYRWLSLTVDMMKYPHSFDVEAYLLFQDIDETKRAELLTIERAETDPLTGILNRTTFADRVNSLIRVSSLAKQHAMIMLDIDGFKQVNDSFGHAAGDQALMDIANVLRSISRQEDVLGRLGGDEFVLFLNNIPGEKVASEKARRICELTCKAFSDKVQISSSVGIAMYPKDGASFDALYKRADETLYHVKESGKNNFAFYKDDMRDGRLKSESAGAKPEEIIEKKKKSRMLIVDDSKIDYEFLANMFKNDFIVERAKNGSSALVRLKYYGTAVSVVLLDLMMPGMDGFAVLEELGRSPETQTIPVIVVSGSDDRETSLRAIRGGASDFVTKPVDPEVLRIRVMSAISKAENERLSAKNSFLELQSNDAIRNKIVLERLHIAVVEMDWRRNAFTYNPSISKYIAGKYDERSLWHILLSDLVTDTNTVKSIQRLLHDVSDNRECMEGNTVVTLKAPDGKQHRFCLNIYKITNEYGTTSKMILTFKDVESELSGAERPENTAQPTLTNKEV